MTRWLARILSICAAVGMLGGCAGLTGQTTATPTTPAEKARAAGKAAIEEARKAFKQAEAAGGEFAAPFEYYLAEAYLELAIHEDAGGDKEGVVVFAKQSAANSGEAI